MDRFNRIFAFHKILSNARYPVSCRAIREKLECSQATFERIKQLMVDVIGAPLEYDRKARGYYYNTRDGERPYELPGLWFNASELHALLAVQKLLENVQPGLLDSHLAPLRERIDKLLSLQTGLSADVTSRVRILGMTARTTGSYFQIIAGALMERRKLHITYHARSSNDISERTVSPQRLIHYRHNWYLDAWCHWREGLRSFAIERITACQPQHELAREIDDTQLDAYFASAYGIFAGPAEHTAVLRFSPDRARWVADEQWHPQQQGRILDDGSYELRLPYGDARELIMDVLKHGPEVEVLSPPSLRQEIQRCLSQMAARYQDGETQK